MSAPAPPAAATAESFPTAELDRRFYAFAIDRLLVWVLYGVAVWAAWVLFLDDGGVVAGLAMIAGVVAVVGVVLSVVLGQRGTSVGKAAVGLRVVHAETGAPIGVGPALLRQLVLGVATLPTLGIGVATLAWTALMDVDRKRRGWHDHLATSVVIDVRPVVVEEEEAPERPRHIVNLTAMRLVPPSPTPPREIPARVRRSRWDDGDQAGAAPAAPAASPAEAAFPAAPAAPAPGSAPSAPSAPAASGAEATNLAGAPPVAGRRRAADPLTDPLAAPAPRPTWTVAFDTGETFTVDGFTLVGRNPEPRPGEPVVRRVALPSQDMSLSKTHAQFQVVPDGALVVMDRGSTNGSLLIRGGVTRELGPGKPAALKDGDVVRFGDREMRVSRS